MASTGVGNRNWPACDQGTAPASFRPWNSHNQLAIGEWNWLARARGMGIGQHATGCDQRTAISGSRNRDGGLRSGNSPSQLSTRDRDVARSGKENRNWPGRNQGRAPASLQPWIGIGQLGLEEQESAISGSGIRNWPAAACDHGLELASSGLGNRRWQDNPPRWENHPKLEDVNRIGWDSGGIPSNR